MHITLYPSAKQKRQHAQQVRKVLIGVCLLGALILTIVGVAL